MLLKVFLDKESGLSSRFSQQLLAHPLMALCIKPPWWESKKQMWSPYSSVGATPSAPCEWKAMAAGTKEEEGEGEKRGRGGEMVGLERYQGVIAG
jgi:hypothetical protein